MNLDELKNIWQEQTASLEGYQLEEQELFGMLEGRSRTLLNKINRNIMIEMGVVVLLTLLGLTWMKFQGPGVGPSELMASLGYVVFSGIFYGIKYRSLNRGRLRTYTLKEALRHIVKVMRTFMNLYYWLSYMLPLFVMGGGLMGLKMEKEAMGQSLADVSGQTWVAFVFTMLVVGFISIFVIRLYVKWLYGKHYNELKVCLDELDESPEAG